VRSAIKSIGLALIVGLSYPVLADVPPPPPPGPDWDMVAFESKFWGAPLSSWTITAQGGGSWVEVKEQSPPRHGAYTQVWHEIEPSIDRYIALERILRRLPVPAPNSSQCNQFMTDQAYGTIRMTRGATTTEIAWNSGCRDPEYLTFLDTLKASDQLIAAAGKAGKIIRTETQGS